QPCVVFVTSGYGKGRVFFSAIDQISRIRMSVSDLYYGAFWDQTIRWLATYRLLGGNFRYKIDTDKESYFVGETATIRVTALDADYQPSKELTLRGLGVEGPDGKPVEVEALKLDRDKQQGLYKTNVFLGSTGSYLVYFDPQGRDGGQRAERRVEVRFATKEDQDRLPDHDLLRRVVERTNPAAHGRVYAPWEIDSLLENIPSRGIERPLDRKDVPLWDTPWLLLLV